MIRRRIFGTLALAATLATPAHAQRSADFRWQGVLAAGGTVSVNNINGDVKVVPSTTGRVDVLGVKRGDSQYFDRIRVDVQPTSRGVTVCVLFEDDASCDDRDSGNRGRSSRREWRDLAINLEVAVPANLMVSASSVSGDVDVRIEQFSGRGDLKFGTVSGNVSLEVPKQFDADLSMTTVSGDIVSDFPLMVGGSRMNRRSIDARIGAGGRRLDLNTVSGVVKLRMIN